MLQRAKDQARWLQTIEVESLVAIKAVLHFWGVAVDVESTFCVVKVLRGSVHEGHRHEVHRHRVQGIVDVPVVTAHD
jgi:hypothetical protein